ncbi:RING finger and transmembrane domain-containing protein 2-like [Neocloeon triangulifer]|uniref:RING finger and transmembrane domain-containing protein 2-like n=1 Tax=Neocloeon triangulifer TaxID=2078957 RepID=UPI00286F11D0|nr:RING finger and transmembrane domain-containing protein 2-like [Neocloeon triangulifer]
MSDNPAAGNPEPARENPSGEAETRRVVGLPLALSQLGRVHRSIMSRPEIFSSVFNELRSERRQNNNPPREPPEEGVSVSIDMGRTEEGADNAAEGPTRLNPETIAMMAMMQRYLPFVLILLVKLLFDHGIGILVGLALLITFSHANSRLKREVGLQARSSISGLVFLLIHILFCIVLFYLVFADEILYSSLWLAPTFLPTSFPDLLWVVLVTDSVLKLITVECKAVLAILPATTIAFAKRGKVFLSIEATSQLYRAVAPVQAWLYYLVNSYEGVYRVLGFTLASVYVLCKFWELLARYKMWHSSVQQLFRHSALGEAPTAQQLATAGNMCTICHDEFSEPVALQVCGHVFCESCLTTWCDREQSCPLCRAKVGTDPAWRDGSTSFFLQLF